MDFYFSPSSSQHALSELTYIPSGVNYCAQIPFTAYGSGSRSVSGTILISVNLSEVPDVYGPTPREHGRHLPRRLHLHGGGPVPAAWRLASIQLLELPASNEGVIYVGSGTSKRADTADPVRLLQRQRADQPAAVRARQRLHRICGNPLCGLQQQRQSPLPAASSAWAWSDSCEEVL